jgi:hypothetical protein
MSLGAAMSAQAIAGDEHPVAALVLAAETADTGRAAGDPWIILGAARIASLNPMQMVARTPEGAAAGDGEIGASADPLSLDRMFAAAETYKGWNGDAVDAAIAHIRQTAVTEPAAVTGSRATISRGERQRYRVPCPAAAAFEAGVIATTGTLSIEITDENGKITAKGADDITSLAELVPSSTGSCEVSVINRGSQSADYLLLTD